MLPLLLPDSRRNFVYIHCNNGFLIVVWPHSILSHTYNLTFLVSVAQHTTFVLLSQTLPLCLISSLHHKSGTCSVLSMKDGVAKLLSLLKMGQLRQVEFVSAGYFFSFC
jgi:hypothetical protein